MVMLNRRSFLANASGLAATLAFRHGLFAQLETAPSTLPDQKLYEKNEDAYWSELRKQFLIPEDEIYLNNGTVGSSPAPVLRAIFDGYTTTEKMDQQDPEGLPHLGIRFLERIPRSLGGFRRLPSRRDCTLEKRYRGQ